MRRRLALLARVAALGLAVGAVGVLALVASGRSPRTASGLAFSVAAVVFGFGLTFWAASLLLGESLSWLSGAAGDDPDWSPADLRQAMAVLAVLGGSGMVGSAVASGLLGG